MRSNLPRWAVAALAALLLVFVAIAYGLRHKPILLHVLAETGCACGEYHEEVTGITLRNPFRDRSPERAAARFLDQLRSGRCTGDISICRYALDEHRVSEWRLANRHDVGDRVQLYYKLTKYVSPEPAYRFSGEGLIEVLNVRGIWTITFYSSYF